MIISKAQERGKLVHFPLSMDFPTTMGYRTGPGGGYNDILLQLATVIFY